MSWVHVLAARIGGLFARRRLERELEQYRERWTFSFFDAIARDVRYAARALRKNPAFTAVSAATLALAIGPNTAMFSVLDAVLFRPLPFRAPEQLAVLWTEIPSQSVREGRTAYRTFEQWRRESRTFADMAVFDPASVTLSGSGGAEQISAARVSPNFLPLLGVQPILGRAFSAREAEERQRLALISYRFWQSRFGGSPGAIGASIELDGIPSRIIGILPSALQHSHLDADVWEPHTLVPDWETRRGRTGAGSWFVFGRLQSQATLEQAQAEMTAIARRIETQSLGVSVQPLSLQVTGPRARLALWMLAGAVFCVLLVAATNVAGLSLARSSSRAAEIAIRGALGASRSRIVRQLLAESLLLALLAGLLGLVVALAGIRIILAVTPGDLARLHEVSLDPQALGWSLVLCLFTGILVGLAPALTLARRDLRSSVQEGARGVSGGVAARGIRRALVVTEFALAMVLLIGAGLLVRSLWSIQSVDPGFQPERVLSMQLSSPAPWTAAQRAGFCDRVLEEVESLPGVHSAAVISNFFIGGNPERAITVEGDGRTTSEQLRFRSDEASAGFFKAVGTPLLAGRYFSAEDRPDSPRVAIVNEAMARRLWPGRDPVGRRFKPGPVGSTEPWFTVVGVAGNMRRHGLETEPIPQMFEPIRQNPPRLATLMVKTSVDEPLKMGPAVQAAVHRVEKSVPVYGVTTLEHRLGALLAQRRFQTWLLIAFSVVALLMAAIGIYGLIQYSIAARTHEIGIRMAVGAQAGQVFRMILGEGLKLSLTGLALGLAGAWWLGHAGSSLLFGVSPTDRLTFATVSLLLAVVAVAACYFPARRAMRVDPAVSLRHG